MKKILQGSLFLLIFPQFLSAQTTDSSAQKDGLKLSRTTLSVGYVVLSPAKSNSLFRSSFFNIHHRVSKFDQYTKPFKFGFFFEPGVNILLPIGKKFFSLPMPYFKVGPEIKITNEFYVGVSFGFNLLFYERSFLPVPFNGLNIFYLTSIAKRNFIEFETGFHSILPFTSDLLFYINVGFSIR